MFKTVSQGRHPARTFADTHVAHEMSTARDRVLGTFELVKLIIESVDEPQYLAVCARVSPVWFEHAIPSLWGRAPESLGSGAPNPDAGHLDQLAATPERFRYYIRYLKNLDLCHGRAPTGVDYDNLWNPQLWKDVHYRCLTVDLGTAIMLQPRMEMLLHPGLLALQLFGGSYTRILFLKA